MNDRADRNGGGRRSATRQALLVLGMHRSGTSALAGLLIKLGARGPKNLMAPQPANPRGYWESEAIRRFHDRLLQSAGTRWAAWTHINPAWLDSAIAARFAGELKSLLRQEFGNARLFTVKDPRICRLLPFWLRNLRALNISPKAILVLRSPIEVARSLYVRDGSSVEHSLLIWLRHVLEAESETRQIDRSLVRYEDLLQDWRTVGDRIGRDIGVKWPRRSKTSDAEIVGFLSPKLRHHAIGVEAIEVATPLSGWVRRTCKAFDLLLEPGTSDAGKALEALDEVRREFNRAAIVKIEGARLVARGPLPVKLQGHALQPSLVSGVWPDGWVGSELTFSFVPSIRVEALEIQITAPKELGARQELDVWTGDKKASFSAATARVETIRAPLEAEADELVDVRVSASRSWRPCETGDSPDRRPLCYRLVSLKLLHAKDAL